MSLRILALACLSLALGAQAPAKPAPGPLLKAGEALVVCGPEGRPQAYGAAGTEHPLGSLSRLLWLKFEGHEWASREVMFKCRGSANGVVCGPPKGHGRVDLTEAMRVGCTLALMAWIEESVEIWRRSYGEDVGRARVEEAFRPFLGKRLPQGETIPVFTPAWLGEGDLLRATPAAFGAWLCDADQAELIGRCQRTFGSKGHLFKDLVDLEDWWVLAAPVSDGAWVAAGNGSLVALLHAPQARSGPEAADRLREILGVKRK